MSVVYTGYNYRIILQQHHHKKKYSEKVRFETGEETSIF